MAPIQSKCVQGLHINGPFLVEPYTPLHLSRWLLLYPFLHTTDKKRCEEKRSHRARIDARVGVEVALECNSPQRVVCLKMNCPDMVALIQALVRKEHGFVSNKGEVFLLPMIERRSVLLLVPGSV